MFWLALLVLTLGGSCQPAASPRRESAPPGPGSSTKEAATSPPTARPVEPLPAYVGRLVEPSTFPHDFSWRQEVTGKYGDRSISFAAVLQKSENTVAVLGLTPFGSRAFLLLQEGQQVTFQKFVDRDIKLDPQAILIDVHRTYFRWLPGAPLPDGEHSGEDGGEVMIEMWSGGKLHERLFRRTADAPGSKPIRIVFHGGALPGQATRLVTLWNGWYGYELILKTVESTAL